jgi:hypothetical protein
VQLFSNNGCFYDGAIPVATTRTYLLSLIYAGGILFLICGIERVGMVTILFALIYFLLVIYKGAAIR